LFNHTQKQAIMKINLQFHGILIAIILILAVNFDRLTAQPSLIKNISLPSESIVSLDGGMVAGH